MKNIIDTIHSAGLTVLLGACGEFLTYMATNDIINNTYNFCSDQLELIGVTGLGALITSTLLGTSIYDSYKNQNEAIK